MWIDHELSGNNELYKNNCEYIHNYSLSMN